MDLETIQIASEIASYWVTIIAICVGGYWTYNNFVLKRERFPSANVEHAISCRETPNGRILLRLEITVSNVGEILINLADILVRIQWVLPIDSQIQKLIDAAHSSNNLVVAWPLIQERRKNKLNVAIEPNEQHTFDLDFVISPSSDGTLPATIRIYSHFRNSKFRGKTRGWSGRSFHDILTK